MMPPTLFRRTLDVLILGIFVLSALPASGAVAGPLTSRPSQQTSEPLATESFSFIPLVMDNYPWRSPFGIESRKLLRQDGLYFARAQELNVNWIRLGQRISWRRLQPEENGPIKWEDLKDLELELRSLKSAGMTPILVVKDSPVWATNNDVRNDGQPTSCGPIRTEKLDNFAEFLRQLVEYFSKPEFNVHHWELGNEPDVDPNLVPPNYAFGCWGHINDRFYGGRHYGEMLKVVTPVIKAQDPTAKVWVGGLLLNTPLTSDPSKGRPELFLQGILEAGAGDYFDILPYHWYPPYFNQVRDYDSTIGLWADWGGGTIGKARFLRGIMEQYGIDKPVVLNETGLLCPPSTGLSDDWLNSYRLTIVEQLANYCDEPDARFYDAQANYLVRAFVRGLSERVKGLLWYTLDGPGWWNTGLLDKNGDPFPAFYAYQQLNKMLQNTRFSEQVDYGVGIEAFAFRRGDQEVHVLWTIENTLLTASVNQSRFVAAYDRQGKEITGTQEEGIYILPVRFSPIYIIRKH